MSYDLIKGKVIRETEKAILLLVEYADTIERQNDGVINGLEIWLPKSKTEEVDEIDGMMIFEIPHWLYMRKVDDKIKGIYHFPIDAVNRTVSTSC